MQPKSPPFCQMPIFAILCQRAAGFGREDSAAFELRRQSQVAAARSQKHTCNNTRVHKAFFSSYKVLFIPQMCLCLLPKHPITH